MRNIELGSDTNLWNIDADGENGTLTFNDVVVFTLHSNGGFGFASYTTTARDLLSDLVAGQTIYNSTTNKLNFYNGSAWQAVTSA